MAKEMVLKYNDINLDDEILIKENGEVIMPSSDPSSNIHMTFDYFLNAILPDGYIYYDEDNNSFIVIENDIIYPVIFDDELTECLNNKSKNRYIRLLKERAIRNREAAVIKMTKVKNEYPKNSQDMDIYSDYLNRQYKNTKAHLTAHGILTILNLGVVTAAFTLRFKTGDWSTTSVLLTATNALSFTSMFIHGLVIKKRYDRKKKDMADFLVYISSLKEDVDRINSIIPTINFDNSITKEINNLIDMVKLVPHEKKSYYSSLIINMFEDYKRDVKNLIEGKDDKTLQIGNDYKSIVNRYIKRITDIQYNMSKDIGINNNLESFDKISEDTEEKIQRLEERVLGR